jgi:hypothetical protein
MPKRVLVFPCGSEVGLEVLRALQFSTHFEVVGASSVRDHGRFAFDDYVEGLPFHDAPDFVDALRRLIEERSIDAIYPTMDAVAVTLTALASHLGIRIIGSPLAATSVCASKSATYALLTGIIPVPRGYKVLDAVSEYPIFLKPDRSHGSRGVLRAGTRDLAEAHLKSRDSAMLILEYLPGDEWTVDCFTDRSGQLRFHAPRRRVRIANGISVATTLCDVFATEFASWAREINAQLPLRGAWFFQAKADRNGQPKLLEVAARVAGSSAIHRGRGVNLPLLTALDAFDHDIQIVPNAYTIDMDRALSNRYRISINYRRIYVDLDDCLLVRGRLNHQLVGFLYKAASEHKRLTLLTRHDGDPKAVLRTHRIAELFDEVIHVTDRDSAKSRYITDADAIFIDDSFAERREVAKTLGIPCFAPDMIEALL